MLATLKQNKTKKKLRVKLSSYKKSMIESEDKIVISLSIKVKSEILDRILIDSVNLIVFQNNSIKL